MDWIESFWSSYVEALTLHMTGLETEPLARNET